METWKGYVENIIFRNEENLYTVLELIVNKKAETVCGKFETVDEGEMLECTGEIVKHPLYGKQMQMKTFRSILPEDVTAMRRYLGSGAIKGIGESLATKIVDTFGEDTFRIIEEEPERLAEIKGISERKAREIALQFADKKNMREAMLFLQKFGIGQHLAVKIFGTYGDRIYEILQKNPYVLADDIDGVGFKTADEIAQKAGISMASEYRIMSGILYTLSCASADGHMYLPKELLLQRAGSILDLPLSEVEPLLTQLSIERKIVIRQHEEEWRVYASRAYAVELSCARMLHDLLMADADWKEKLTRNQVMSDGTSQEEMTEGKYVEAEAKIRALEKLHQLELDDVQRMAVVSAVTSGVFLLTGGPGTGKTTTTKMMIEYFRSENMDFFLAAPTGRAAKRMQETTGYEAKTIHRLLELSGISEEGRSAAHFERNEENPLEADAIIIDEVSMVDIYLFQALLRAVAMGTRLILVGDANQLPSVGPGQVLRDLIEAGVFPTVVLQKIFRQARESDIVMNAHGIHAGEHIPLGTQSKDFFFLERNDASVIVKHMVTFITGKLPAYANASPLEIQVLSPMKKGPLGVYELNRALQAALNPPSAHKKEYQVNDLLLREGDKVMQIKNDYQLEWEVQGMYKIPIARGMGVFNGDMGVLQEIDENAQTLLVKYDAERLVRYPFSLAEELELAYAVTIHKSQGSEYPGIILPLLAVPDLLASRNILYTAMTRAKNCCVLMGSRDMVYHMIDNDRVQMRYSGFVSVLKELILREE